MSWFTELFRSDDEIFSNQGTTKREKRVAPLLNKKMPGRIVEFVRFGGVGNSLYVSVDLHGGRTIGGGYVEESMSAAEQAQSIYQHINASMNI